MSTEVSLPEFIKLTEKSDDFGATIFDNSLNELKMHCDSQSSGVSNSLYHSILLDAVIMLQKACDVMNPTKGCWRHLCRFQAVLYVKHNGEYYFTKDYMYTNITL